MCTLSFAYVREERQVTRHIVAQARTCSRMYTARAAPERFIRKVNEKDAISVFLSFPRK